MIQRLPSPQADPGRLWEAFTRAYVASGTREAVDRFLGALAALNPSREDVTTA